MGSLTVYTCHRIRDGGKALNQSLITYIDSLDRVPEPASQSQLTLGDLKQVESRVQAALDFLDEYDEYETLCMELPSHASVTPAQLTKLYTVGEDVLRSVEQARLELAE